MKQKKHKAGKVLLKLAGIMLAFIILMVGACVAYACSIIKDAAPIDPENIYDRIEQTTYIYDSAGNVIDTLCYSEDRILADIDEMPDNLKNAFIAIEDKTFYRHHGFNFRRMIGAVWDVVTGRSESIGGTSTITQQLARNVYLPDIKTERTVNRKLTEMYYAFEIERVLSKDEILEAYLNTIYLGHGSYGVASAAKLYFSKKVSELDLGECAALAALPQAPDEYALLKSEGGEHRKKIKGTDLYSNDTSGNRRRLILDLMAEQGYIDAKEAESAKTVMSKMIRPSLPQKDYTYTYFTDYAAGEVIKALADEQGIPEEEAEKIVYTGGLRIYTTLDSDIQNIIFGEFSEDRNFPIVYNKEDKAEAAMVVTEVGTGRILAMIGGRNASGKKLFNRATSPRQPGSSIKPLTVYGAALQKSLEYAETGQKFPFIDFHIDKQRTRYWGDYITAGSTVVDEKLKINGETWPYNVTRKFSGKMTFRKALQQSVNTCAVKIQMQLGNDYSALMLKKFGITTMMDDATRPVNDLNPAALALGAMTYGVTPLEMAMAYAVFPNGGILNSPVCFDKVTDSEGNIILQGKSHESEVLDEGVAWIMTDLLKSNVSRGIAGNAYIYGTNVGGKTGTTNDRYDIWFDGFTPKYSASLWIGVDRNYPLSSRSEAAARLWRNIMIQIPDITEGEYRKAPDNVVYKNGEYYTKGTENGSTQMPKEEKKESEEEEDVLNELPEDIKDLFE